MFNKKYQLTLHKDYVSSWGLQQAVREFIQNALDSESSFKYEIAPDSDSTFFLKIISEQSTLSASSLVLGGGTKSENSEAIGSFGEGYKLAILVLTRLERQFKIYNGHRCWRTSFELSKTFGIELLTITEEDLPFHHKGLTVFIEKLSAEEVESLREICLIMQPHVGKIFSTRYGDILLEKPGKLYVGGLFICETELEYGYDIKPSYIKLERDRQTVSNFDLKWLVKDMWFDSKQWDYVAEGMDKAIKDLEYSNYGQPELVKEACYKRFKAQYPDGIVAKNQKELDDLVKRGLSNVIVVTQNFYEAVSTSASYDKVEAVKLETPAEHLTKWFENNKRYMNRYALTTFKTVIKEAKTWRKSN